MTSSDGPGARVPLAKLLPLGLGQIALVNSASAWVAWRWGGELAIVASVLLGALSAVGVVRWGGAVIGAAVLAGLSASGTALGVDGYSAGASGDHVRGISVADAPRFPSASTFRFVDGRVRSDLKGFYEVRTQHRSGISDVQVYHVAPLVPDGWTPTQPVPAWAVSGLDTEYSRVWREPRRGGVVDHGSSREFHAKARDQAERAYGLASASNAPLIRWVSDPEGDLRSDLVLVAWIVGIAIASWCLGMPLIRRARKV